LRRHGGQVRFASENVMDNDAVIERDGTLLAPAWLGPAKLFVLRRGRAYQFGIFALTAGELLFAAGAHLLVQISRAEATIGWPGHLLDAGLFVQTATARYSICFFMPFTDAPAPNLHSVPDAASVLSGVSALGFLAWQDGPGAAVVTGLVKVAAAAGGRKQGRRAADRVRAALTG
jgi:hypothetical protein